MLLNGAVLCITIIIIILLFFILLLLYHALLVTVGLLCVSQVGLKLWVNRGWKINHRRIVCHPLKSMIQKQTRGLPVLICLCHCVLWVLSNTMAPSTFLVLFEALITGLNCYCTNAFPCLSQKKYWNDCEWMSVFFLTQVIPKSEITAIDGVLWWIPNFPSILQ